MEGKPRNNQLNSDFLLKYSFLIFTTTTSFFETPKTELIMAGNK